MPGGSPFKDFVAGRPVKGATVPAHGDLLRWNGTNTPAVWEAQSLVYDRVVADTDVVNTANETTFYSKSVAANDLQTNRTLLLQLEGDYFNNSGAPRTFTIRVKLGATTAIDIQIPMGGNITVSPTRRPWRWQLTLQNRGATNAQWLYLHGIVSTAGASPTAGVGDATPGSAAPDAIFLDVYNTAAVDTTAAQTLVLTVQHSVADANLSFRIRSALAVLL